MPIGDITPSSSINSTATEPTVVERMHRLAGGQTKKEEPWGKGCEDQGSTYRKPFFLLGFSLKRFAKEGECGLAVTSRTNRRSSFHK